ncbi:MAG TPA: CAP domain-containing protein [Oscillatoriaceae cyanobacterium]
MRHVLRFPLILAIAAALSPAYGCAAILQHAAEASGETPIAADHGPVRMTADEYHVLQETNAFRTAHGLPALEPDERLVEVARSRSDDMAKHDYFSHQSPNGGDVFSMMHALHIYYALAGENIARNAYGKRAADVAVRGWIDSPGHRANILHPGFGHIGIGIEKDKQGRTYLTEVFTE